MDKVAKLKDTARVLASGGILGAGGGVLATEQIRRNKHSARSTKGWNTRRARNENT